MMTQMIETIELKEFLSGLRGAMKHDYTAVNRRKNPIALQLPALGMDELMYVAGQYAIFPKNIVSFLSAASETAKQHGYTAIHEELERNIGEERGSKTAGIPHYDLLVRETAAEFGHAFGYAPAADLEADLRALETGPAMDRFVKKMKEITTNEDLEYAIGATYALEASASPELVIVWDVLNALHLKAYGSALPVESGLAEFVKMHLLDFEVGHEVHLREALSGYVQAVEQQDRFRNGFHDTILAMELLWFGLRDECQTREVRLRYGI